LHTFLTSLMSLDRCNAMIEQMFEEAQRALKVTITPRVTHEDEPYVPDLVLDTASPKIALPGPIGCDSPLGNSWARHSPPRISERVTTGDIPRGDSDWIKCSFPIASNCRLLLPSAIVPPLTACDAIAAVRDPWNAPTAASNNKRCNDLADQSIVPLSGKDRLYAPLAETKKLCFPEGNDKKGRYLFPGGIEKLASARVTIIGIDKNSSPGLCSSGMRYPCAGDGQMLSLPHEVCNPLCDEESVDIDNSYPMFSPESSKSGRQRRSIFIRSIPEYSRNWVNG